MQRKSRNRRVIALLAGCLAAPVSALAQDASVAAPAAEPVAARPPTDLPPLRDGARWELTFSPYTLHWHNDQDRKNVWLVALSRLQADGSIWGFAAFTNSFGQPSAYGYYGHIWEGLFGKPRLYAKLTAGILYGYKGKYENKVPFNHNGWSPAIIPSMGWRFTANDALEVAALGSAGLTFMYNRRF